MAVTETVAASVGSFWAPCAWLDGRWQEGVRFAVDAQGCWLDIRAGVAASTQDFALSGPVVPGLVDAHSHSFQRAFAGLAEVRLAQRDDFWSWRDRMYRVAGRISVAGQRAVAAQLFRELLSGGFTQVCEFHYLHHAEATAGEPHQTDQPVAMALAIAEAARDAGIGLTLIPSVYERSGFDAASLRPDQARFRADARSVLDICRTLREELAGASSPPVQVAVAVHSLRAAHDRSVRYIADHAGDGPVHIHASEQLREVEECLHSTGRRPVEWLAHEGLLDARWQLVHATHLIDAEIDAVGRAGAGIVVCPGTEANLGDGVPAATAWFRAGIPTTLGTDSHVSRSVAEELRQLEYAQRSSRRERILAADVSLGGSNGAYLFERMLRGGARAAGLPCWGFIPGARADLVVLDDQAPALLGVPRTSLLDAWIFSAPVAPCAQVMVAGRWVRGRHQTIDDSAITGRFRDAMHALWRDDAG